MKNNQILIITNKGDITTDLVVKRLIEKKISYVRFNTEDYPEHIESQICVGSKQSTFLKIGEKKLNVDQISSVWFRRPKNSVFSRKLNLDDLLFSTRESNAFIQNFWSIIDHKRWVNCPFSLHKAERKAYQLQIAERCGLNIPQSIITNSFDEFNKFLITQKNKVIVKPVSNGSYGPDENFAIYTVDLEKEDYVINQEKIRCSPLILQKKIEKKFDVRINLFGNKIFGYRILTEGSNIDWRVYDHNEIEYQSYEIPVEIKTKLLKFMFLLDLKFGAFDFVVDKKNRWYFIEVNPSGQFAWLEILTGDKNIDSLIDLLTNDKL